MSQIIQTKECLTEQEMTVLLKQGGTRFWWIADFWNGESFEIPDVPGTQKLNVKVDLKDGDYVAGVGGIRLVFKIQDGIVQVADN